jgi:hypothetical protein
MRSYSCLSARPSVCMSRYILPNFCKVSCDITVLCIPNDNFSFMRSRDRVIGIFFLFVLLYLSRGDCEDGEVGAMKCGYQTRARTRAAAVGSQRLTASAMARP